MNPALAAQSQQKSTFHLDAQPFIERMCYPTGQEIEGAMKTLLIAVLAIAAAYGSSAYAGEAVQNFSDQPSASSGGESRVASGASSSLRFELIGQPRQNGGIGKMHSADSESMFLVRLVWASNGAPITNAKVALLRVDMSPDGMDEMTARAYVRPYGDPGSYRVEVHPLMAGRWAVTLDGHMADHPVSVRQVLTVALSK